MPPRDWAFRIQDVLESIAKIQRYVSGVDFEEFKNDEEIMDAVVHNLTVIGGSSKSHPFGDHRQPSGNPMAADDRSPELLSPRLLESSPRCNLGHHPK
jgi:hypothetical protein